MDVTFPRMISRCFSAYLRRARTCRTGVGHLTGARLIERLRRQSDNLAGVSGGKFADGPRRKSQKIQLLPIARLGPFQSAKPSGGPGERRGNGLEYRIFLEQQACIIQPLRFDAGCALSFLFDSATFQDLSKEAWDRDLVGMVVLDPV